MTSQTIIRHLNETALCLRREGFTVEQLPDGKLSVIYDGGMLCTVEKPGGISYRPSDISSPEIMAAKDRAYEIVSTVAEYMQAMDRSPYLKVPGVSAEYKSLIDFNGTVLAGTETKYGVNFVTWDWDFNYGGLSHGHYYSGNFNGAKKDFAVRSGMVENDLFFNEDQLIEMYRCCTDTLDENYILTRAQVATIRSIKEQISKALPNIHELISSQSESELSSLTM